MVRPPRSFKPRRPATRSCNRARRQQACSRISVITVPKSSRPKVLLVPEGGLYLAFRLPPLFRSAGWDVELLCVAGDPMVHSRYVETVFQEESRDLLEDRLKQILRDPQRPWQAVIVAHEGTMRRMVATEDPSLLKSWQPGALTKDVREFLLGKFALAAVHERQLWLVPASKVCQTVAEIQEFGHANGWPIIVKPGDLSGGKGVVKFDSPAALESNQEPLVLPTLAQKYIQGQRGVVDMLCAGGRPLAWLASDSTKRAHGEFSPSTARNFRAIPELQPLVEQVARFTKFEGFCGFDWIKEANTGQYYLIEFHPRPSSGFRFGRSCGVDFPAAIAAWLRFDSGTFPTQVQAPGSLVVAHYFSGDLTRCLRMRDWRGLAAWLPGSGASHDVYWDDPPLLFALMWRKLLRCFRRNSRSTPG